MGDDMDYLLADERWRGGVDEKLNYLFKSAQKRDETLAKMDTKLDDLLAWRNRILGAVAVVSSVFTFFAVYFREKIKAVLG